VNSVLLSLDNQIFQLINLSYHNPLLNNLSLLISYLGVIVTILVIAVLLALFDKKKGKKVALLLCMGVVLSIVLTLLFKYTILRPRPYTVIDNVVLLAVELDPSFPSGHTVNSTVLAYTLSREYDKKIFMLIPLFVGLSRIYIGVHYPSDVICGFILGIFITMLSEKIFDKILYEKIRKTLKD
jgi:undecaprenyl-diphosphatase